MCLLFNENEIPIQSSTESVQILKLLFHFVKTREFELAGKGGSSIAVKYKINYFSLNKHRGGAVVLRNACKSKFSVHFA